MNGPLNLSINKVTKGAVAVAALATVQQATKQARKVLAPHDPPGWGRSSSGRRTHVVTVNLPMDRVAPGGEPPAGLRDLPDVSVDVRPAPGDKGTELAVTGEDHDAIRKALRDTKALLEVGEVVQPAAEGSAEPTLLNAPLRAATAHAKEGGRL
jgi:hypothetical protein